MASNVVEFHPADATRLEPDTPIRAVPSAVDFGEDAAVRPDANDACRRTHRVPISDLLPADSPRHGGEDLEHAKALSQVHASLPPILVHKPTMRVIDGMHRLTAAIMLASREITVEYFEGSQDDAFVEAVRSNVSHGKPLTLAERESAAQRILSTNAGMSDRAIASACGLSAKTVAAMRRRATAENPQLHKRIGIDGRVRPVDPTVGRAQAAEFLRENPAASLREVGHAVGISPNTVRDVRARLRQEISHVERQELEDAARSNEVPRPRCDLEMVVTDSALRANEACESLLDWLSEHAIERGDWVEFVEVLPLSRLYLVADLAMSVSNAWNEFANALERRAGKRH